MDWTKIISIIIIVIGVSWTLIYLVKYAIKSNRDLKLALDLRKQKGNFEVSYVNKEADNKVSDTNSEETASSASIDKTNPLLISKKIERSINIVDGKIERKIRFRVGKTLEGPTLYDATVKAYLVTRKTMHYPDNNGYGNTWQELRIDGYLPIVNRYWTISHFIDSEQKDSPILKIKKGKDILKIQVHIFISGNSETGQKYYKREIVDLNEGSCIFGTFKLREIGETDLKDEDFSKVVPDKNIKGDWKFLS